MPFGGCPVLILILLVGMMESSLLFRLILETFAVLSVDSGVSLFVYSTILESIYSAAAVGDRAVKMTSSGTSQPILS